MIKKGVLIIVLVLIFLFSSVYGKEISFTQEDRERLIRIETRLDTLEKRIDTIENSVNRRIDGIEKRIDDLRDLIYVVLGGMIALIGFVIWDRRTALSPVIRRYKELEERGDRIERALRELARRDERVAEVLKIVGLL